MSEPSPLPPPDSHYLSAAEGWLQLGNYSEATAELEQIRPEFQTHSAVLLMHWEICAAQKQWGTALEIAAKLIQLDPDHPLGWVHRSYGLHELKRTQEARENLLRVVDKFPQDAIMRFNLACYECQLGRLQEAKQWLQKAIELDGEQVKLMALDDPDLEPLWSALGEMDRQQ